MLTKPKNNKPLIVNLRIFVDANVASWNNLAYQLQRYNNDHFYFNYAQREKSFLARARSREPTWTKTAIFNNSWLQERSYTKILHLRLYTLHLVRVYSKSSPLHQLLTVLLWKASKWSPLFLRKTIAILFSRSPLANQANFYYPK